MDTRKETFKGLTGLGGIDEQDEDEDSFPLPEMDMDDFREDDFMDEAEHWDDLEASDSDLADPTSDEGPGYRTDDAPGQQTDDDHIPQFDGGGDLHNEDDAGKKQETYEDKWKKITIRRKRGRDMSSSIVTPIEQSPKAKRFRDLEPAGGSGGQSLKPVTPPILIRQRSRTAGASSSKPVASSSKPVASAIHGSPAKTPASRSLKATSPDQYSTPDDEVNLIKTFRGKYILDSVEILKKEAPLTPSSSSRSSQSLTKKPQTPVKTTRYTPKVYEEVEDDPIEDFDDGEAEDEKLDELPMEELAGDGPDVFILDTPPISRAPLGPSSPLSDLVSPPSPRQNYFLSTLEEVWSSPSPEMSKPDFFFSPPRPRSPDLIPAHSTPTKADSSISNTSRQTPAPLSSSTPQTSPEKSRSSQRKRSSGAMSDLDIINETVFICKSDLAELLGERDVKRKGSLESGDGRYQQAEHSESLDKLSSGILVDDSIAVDEIEACTPPKESSPSQQPGQQHSPPISEHSSSPPQYTASSLQNESQIPYNPYLAQALTGGHGEASDIQAYQFSFVPPTTKSLISSLPEFGLPNRVHQKPYFSNEADVPSKVKVFGGKEFRLQSKGLKSMPQFKGRFDLGRKLPSGAGYQYWESNVRPPSYAEALVWLKEDKERVKARSAAEASTQQKREKISQIEGPTQKNPFGCKNTPTKVAGSVAIEKDYLDVLSMEVHCRTRGGLLPDPKVDPILAVFYCWQTEREGLASKGWVPG